MIAKEIESQILRLYHAEKWPTNTIAFQLGIHHSVVTRVLAAQGLPAAHVKSRPRLIDAYMPFIVETFKKYPKICASRLYRMVKERGYPGAEDHFRHMVKPYRPHPHAEAFLRLKTLPGEQAQVDWGHFGKIRIGAAERFLMGFVMVLSWSRMIFLRFYLNQKTENFLRGHVAAFDRWKGIPRICLYDNLKSAVLERRQDAIHFNPKLLNFSGYYHYEPRPVAPARGNEKGRVERAILYTRRSFFAARPFHDLDDLNRQAEEWCEGQAAERRCPEDRALSVREAFAEEQKHLLQLPNNPYCTDERVEVSVGKTPYIRFDGNLYSVPHTAVKRTLTVFASLKTVRILDGLKEIATHPRSFDRHQQIEDQAHVAELIAVKRKARQHRGIDRLAHAVPNTKAFFKLAAERGKNLGRMTQALLVLLDEYGAVELEQAVAEALESNTPHVPAVRFVLEKRRRQKGKVPPIPVELPNDPRLHALTVKPHTLSSYDKLHLEEDDDED